MVFVSIFFIILSILSIIYIITLFKTGKRFSVLFEILSIGVYTLVLLLFLFPNLLNLIEITFGISSGINFIIYLSIFIAYFIIFILYQKSEEQRVEITKLVREIAYLKNGKKNKK